MGEVCPLTDRWPQNVFLLHSTDRARHGLLSAGVRKVQHRFWFSQVQKWVLTGGNSLTWALWKLAACLLALLLSMSQNMEIDANGPTNDVVEGLEVNETPARL